MNGRDANVLTWRYSQPRRPVVRCFYFERMSTGSTFINRQVHLTRSAGGGQRPAGVFQRWWAGKKGPQAPAWRWPVHWSPPTRQPGRRRQGVAWAEWSAGSRDRAELQPCLLQPPRCSGRRHDAVTSTLPAKWWARFHHFTLNTVAFEHFFVPMCWFQNIVCIFSNSG